MNRLVICTHGEFGRTLKESAELIVGPIKDIEILCLSPGEDPYDYKKRIENYLKQHEQDYFLFLVDLFGGTPSNMASTFVKDFNIEIVSGLNLAMLIEVYSNVNRMPIKLLGELAITTSINNIKNVKSELLSNQKERL
ncbi:MULTISPECIES: PTS sugar transporter subunit IIA [Bacillota]|uniref:PTS mannose transporter subunit IIA n=1 Tax=Faecalicoccus pleomorphus TaxID=1323 RepID=A0A3E3E7T6_9FIRM|nr:MULTISPECIES: PTS mannose transporter subunit IIA [Bacillota]MBE6119744.1 PTS mannose transporter subunit IIA [Erysipelotrichaceae bacterium]MDB7983914.1 PTS mannose transporter subunit IIA [Faecalicoccus pleomorphus]MDY5110429.1 PTS mannose transporter subunit IIA [Faecalicoccus sp.]MDY5436841.1 hypothetical protein [Peptostreptococcus porci]NME44544.1 PTS mannose transporter subunit IIA [Faecalicoccus pleomorphus]